MGKKYIEIDGKRHYIKDEAGAGTDNTGVDEEEETPIVDDGDDTDTPAEITKAANKAAQKILASIGLDKVDMIEKKLDQMIEDSNPSDSKLKQILNGKHYVREKDALTKEEKIVGFFYGLVNKNDSVIKALAEGVDADGGYLIPEEFMAEIVTDLADLNIMRRLVRVVTMRRNRMAIPATASKPDVYWTAENAAKTTTTARFAEKNLVVKKLAAIIYASDEMIEDSTEFDMVQFIIGLFAEAIAMREEQAIILGNGTTQIRGLETARGNSEFTTISAAGAQNFDSIIRLEYSLPAKYAANASYLMNRTTASNVRRFKDGNGNYIWQPSVVAGQPSLINGKPVYEVDWLPNGVVYYGDFKRAYWLGDRKSMTVKVSQESETAFTKDQTAIRVVHRVAGEVVQPSAVRVLTGL